MLSAIAETERLQSRHNAPSGQKEPIMADIYRLTEPVPLYHPNLHEARAFGAKGKESGTPKYSGNLGFAPTSEDLKAMKTLAAKVARARWPDRPFTDKENPRRSIAFPFTNGDRLADTAKDKKKDGEFNRGKIIVAARSKFEPGLAGIENNKAVDYEGAARAAAKSKFYFGVEVFAEVNFVAYDGVGANPDGVTCYLNKVFTTGKGTKINVGVSAAEVFKGYAGNVSAEDPTAGKRTDLDDEIPF